MIKATTNSEETVVVNTTGQISASWQNFLICVEMLIAAFLLRIAFPANIYDKVSHHLYFMGFILFDVCYDLPSFSHLTPNQSLRCLIN